MYTSFLTQIDASSTTRSKEGERAMAKEDLINVVRRLLREVVKARFEGGAYARLSRAHGYADGYMAALLDAGVVERDSLLRMVGEERLKLAIAPSGAH
jgi:hypothetical protein